MPNGVQQYTKLEYRLVLLAWLNNLLGYDSNKAMLADAGAPSAPGAAGSLLGDRLPDLKAEYMLANAPFNMKEWGGERLREDTRWKFDVPRRMPGVVPHESSLGSRL